MSVLLKVAGTESEKFEAISGTFDPVVQMWDTDIINVPAEMSGRTSTSPTRSQTTSAPPEMNDEDQDDQEQDPDPE